MEKPVLNILKTLRQYAQHKGLQLAIFYHEERSALMRFANSAISLNTSEHLVRLELVAYEGRKKATYGLIVNPQDLAAMQAAVEKTAEMVKVAEPLSYQPTFPIYTHEVVDTRAYDPALASMSNAERLAFFNQLGEGLESKDHQLSGFFMDGVTITAQTSTASEHSQYFASTDAKITAVISSEMDKWEVNAEQSAQKKTDLDASALHEELSLLVKHYMEDKPVQLPVGKYTVVLGPGFTAEIVDILCSWACMGGAMKRGYSCFKEEDQGTRVLSEHFSAADDPEDAELYAQSADMMGVPRERFPLFDKGVFTRFTWDQDSADEYGQKATGHSVQHQSIVIGAGDAEANSLRELLAMPRDEDLLYIPYLHYINIVNPSAGVITGSSRFGALLLKKDGTVEVPYNVRITQSFMDLFGEGVAWMSSRQMVYNVSSSYGQRNPTAVKLPRFICTHGVEISHSNSSY
ncbi:MAG TPA: metallopeptidase TldD-related protein [Anaerolineaceae bacterium]|nr:metallopeptidase TldD-related protein [Anaerolineaceae bacterium]